MSCGLPSPVMSRAKDRDRMRIRECYSYIKLKPELTGYSAENTTKRNRQMSGTENVRI
jgi:uncharacterized protein YggE